MAEKIKFIKWYPTFKENSMANDVQKISIKEKIGYGFGDTASNLFFQTFIAIRQTF